ncbi:hypothetical protein BJ170DRAFT_684913 [Xylariales sp. AK1849]|nr:hypothetical protein BJ170DRAFT_684913 [Xylariales sp. AK1849]
MSEHLRGDAPGWWPNPSPGILPPRYNDPFPPILATEQFPPPGPGFNGPQQHYQQHKHLSLQQFSDHIQAHGAHHVDPSSNDGRYMPSGPSYTPQGQFQPYYASPYQHNSCQPPAQLQYAQQPTQPHHHRVPLHNDRQYFAGPPLPVPSPRLEQRELSAHAGKFNGPTQPHARELADLVPEAGFSSQFMTGDSARICQNPVRLYGPAGYYATFSSITDRSYLRPQCEAGSASGYSALAKA